MEGAGVALGLQLERMQRAQDAGPGCVFSIGEWEGGGWQSLGGDGGASTRKGPELVF